ncbi:unnamed protein product [Hapterophycus canaliculatus]
MPGDFRMRLDDRAGGKGKPSKTFVQVLEQGSYRGRAVTKVLFSRPHTGRRHQLRLHALHMGHPILGDTTYGNADHTIPRMCLHAQSLQLQLAPRSGASNTSTAATSEAAAAAAVATEVSATEVARRGKRYWGRQVVKPPAVADVGAGSEVTLDVIAPDPFVFVEGELQL